MFESNKVYKNRYGDTYKWIVENETTYRFDMNKQAMKYCRFGAKKNAEEFTMLDLSMFDPSGGPYVCLGMEIDGKAITKIYCKDNDFYVECI